MKSFFRCLSVLALCSFLSVSSCNKYVNDPDLKLARDFIDAYYVMADQTKAMTLSSDRAEEALRKEAELVKGIEGRERAYAARDVVFDLKDSRKTGDEADYFYELKIIQPELGDTKKTVHLVIDRKAGKVKSFGEIE